MTSLASGDKANGRCLWILSALAAALTVDCRACKEVIIPENTIPLMPHVPLIPKSVWKPLKHANITVNYSYYYDPESNESCFTTEDMLRKVKGEFWFFQGDDGRLAPTMVAQNFVGKTILLLIVAYFYKQNVSDKRESQLEPLMQNPLHDFHFGVFQCFQDLPICFFACCCFPIRIADTLSAAKIMGLSFWHVIGVVLAVDLFYTVLYCFGFDTDVWKGLLYAVVFGYMTRQKIRESLGSPKEQRPVKTLLQDVLCWCCCSACAAAQEAREIDLAQGVAFTCPCGLKKAEFSLVGNAIGVSETS